MQISKRWRMSSNPEIKAKVEMPFIWSTFKDELELRIMPARVHAYFVLGHAAARAYSDHVNRVNSALHKASQLGICPARVRTRNDGDEKHKARLEEEEIYKTYRAQGDPNSKLAAKPRKKPIERKQ